MEQKQVSLNEIYQKLLILEKSMKKMDVYIEDLEFARETREAWERYDKGEFKSLPADKFLKELEKW